MIPTPANEAPATSAPIDSTIVIPAFRPGPVLAELTETLAALGFRQIVIVDDGSGEEHRPRFDRLAAMEPVTVLRHGLNRGKGAALKTAFEHLLGPDQRREARPGGGHRLVTVDADGQHTPEDVLAVSRRGHEHAEALVLGARDFSAADLPWRSRFGNTLTRRLLRWTHGLALEDTQTGLRSLPAGFARETLDLPSDRYEFELECLFLARRRDWALVEHPIRTLYEEGNASSHFRPLVDSIRVYRVLLADLLPRGTAR